MVFTRLYKIATYLLVLLPRSLSSVGRKQKGRKRVDGNEKLWSDAVIKRGQLSKNEPVAS